MMLPAPAAVVVLRSRTLEKFWSAVLWCMMYWERERMGRRTLYVVVVVRRKVWKVKVVAL